jgi:3-deoxy-D-manno-octulosonate 8-phosphate phosphatase (KDO 8-P phosphatase)
VAKIQAYTALSFSLSVESVNFVFLYCMELLDKFKQIRLLAFDLDGVLTNGKLLLTASGEWVREMDIKDGFALQHAVKCGLYVAVITGSSSQPVAKRLERLGIQYFYENATSKGSIITSLMNALGLESKHVLFTGDDIPDLDAFKVAGLCCSPADAVPEIRDRADYISFKAGGDGAVRDIIEKTLRVQDKWLTTEGIQSI